jgi:hypothetical protein
VGKKMVNPKKDLVLSEVELIEIEGFVINTLNRMLSTEELVFDAFEKYDLILSFSSKGEYIQGSVFQLSRCEVDNGTLVDLHQPPLFVGRRHYLKMEDFEQFIDEESLEHLSESSLQAFLGICGIIRSFNLHKK